MIYNNIYYIIFISYKKLSQTYRYRMYRHAKIRFNIPEHFHEALGPDEESIENVSLLIKEIGLYNLIKMM